LTFRDARLKEFKPLACDDFERMRAPRTPFFAIGTGIDVPCEEPAGIGVQQTLPPPARADFAALLSGITSVEIDVHKTFASGPVVMMDRTDRLVWPDRTIAGRWIGIFAVKEGRVAEFTDYTIERWTTP